MDDFYKVLGVRRDASQADIQKAYRDLARKHHPDMNPDDKGAKKKFQELQAAFDVLNDPEKRKMYDQYGSAYQSMGAGGPRGGPGFGGAPGGFEFDMNDPRFADLFGGRAGGGMPGDVGDIFRQFMGGGAHAPKTRRGAGAARRGNDVTAEVTVALNTAVSGGEVQIDLERGGGRVEHLTAKIPAGIEEGKKIRLRGQGEPGPRGGTPGDLLITVRVAAHPWFQRQGNHLHVKVPVTLAEALNGATVDVPTPNGTVALRVPPGTSSGTKLRIKGQGAPSKSGPGDLLAEVQIIVPHDISPDDQKLIRDLDERYPLEPRQNLRW